MAENTATRTEGRTCVFCGEHADSREHVIPEWLSKRMGIRQLAFHPAHYGESDGIQVRPAIRCEHLRTKQVCKRDLDLSFQIAPELRSMNNGVDQPQSTCILIKHSWTGDPESLTGAERADLECERQNRRPSRRESPFTKSRMKTLIRFALALFGTGIGLWNSCLRADDQKNIVGVWKGGMPGDPPGGIELRITPTRITGRNPRTGESLGEGTYKLDPVKKTIDPHRVEKFGRGKTYLGLYSLEGRTLKWVSNSRGNKRPVDLVHRPDRDQFLMVLERQR